MSLCSDYSNLDHHDSYSLLSSFKIPVDPNDLKKWLTGSRDIMTWFHKLSLPAHLQKDILEQKVIDPKQPRKPKHHSGSVPVISLATFLAQVLQSESPAPFPSSGQSYYYPQRSTPPVQRVPRSSNGSSGRSPSHASSHPSGQWSASPSRATFPSQHTQSN